MPQHSKKKRGPRDCCWQCRKQCGYVYKVWLHPGEWIRWSTKWMTRYTNQRVIIRFGAFEVISSILAVSFFAWVRWVTDLDGLDSQWFLFNASMAYRGVYGLVGLRGAWHRKVRFTWVFSGMMFINVFVSLTAMMDLAGFSCIRTPSIEIMAPWENHDFWDNNTNQDLLLLSYFEIPDPRIYFKSAPSQPQPICEVIHEHEDPYAVEASLLAVREGRSRSDPDASTSNATNSTSPEDLIKREEGEWTSTPSLLYDREKGLDSALRTCMLQLDCGMVEVRLQRATLDVPQGLRVCIYPTLSLVPYVDHTFACTSRMQETAPRGCVLPDVSVFFLKDVTKSARQMLGFGQIEDEQEVVCHLSRDILIGTIFLSIASNCFMLVIVVKFAMNRCGDHFDAEIQFEVEFSSDEDYSGDEGTWITSRTRANTQRASIMTRGSITSSANGTASAGLGDSVATLAADLEMDARRQERRKSRKSISKMARGSVSKTKSVLKKTAAPAASAAEEGIEMSSPWRTDEQQQTTPRKVRPSVRFTDAQGKGGSDAPDPSAEEGTWPLNWGFR